MTEPENIILEHLRAIRGDIARMADGMQTLSAEMTAMRQHLSGVVTIQEHDPADIGSITVRLDRLEKRLQLAD
jgi:hypothetical protein